MDMNSLRPRTNKKYVSSKTEENLQCLVIRQYKQYLPSVSRKALFQILTNVPRPRSSKPQQIVNSNQRIQSRQCSNSNKSQYLPAQKEVQKNNNPKLSPPVVSSKYWAVYQIKSERLIYGVRSRKKIEVASLTKIMNLVSIWELVKDFSLNPREIKVAMSELATSMIGTSAQLKRRDVVSLEDLMYAMMLPSGNDAACQIAMIGGAIIKLAQLGKVNKIYEREEVESLIECRSNIIRYIGLMNKLSFELGMESSKWANPHGLSNKQNKTTVEDICKLCKKAMQNEEIRKIVNTKLHSCSIETYFGKVTERRTVSWENTNKMLWRGWSGIKTGCTPNAGPCLAASYRHTEHGKDYQFLAVIADCANMNQRWEEVEQIVQWAIKNERP